LPVHVKARAENAAADARQALKEAAPADRLRNLTAELRQVSQELAAAGPGPQGGPGQQGGPGPQGGPAGGGNDDDVIDAEFTPSE
jgi:molecular chaperone DnaK